MSNKNLHEVNFLTLVPIQQQAFRQQISLENLALYFLPIIWTVRNYEIYRFVILPNLWM